MFTVSYYSNTTNVTQVMITHDYHLPWYQCNLWSDSVMQPAWPNNDGPNAILLN